MTRIETADTLFLSWPSSRSCKLQTSQVSTHTWDLMRIHPWKVSNFAKLPEKRRQLVVDHEAALVAWGLMEGMEVREGSELSGSHDFHP